jgi:hypothetical protein
MLESLIRFAKVSVWLCATSFIIIIPHILETEQHEIGTQNTRFYRNMLEKIMPYEMRHLGLRIVWFQRFPWICWRPSPEQLIGTKVVFASPSSVLMVLDFLSARVIQTHPAMLEELKRGIQTDCGHFTGRASESNVKPTFLVNNCSAFERRRLTVITFKV